MYNYKIILSYDGGRYNGWQVQGNTCDTIQGKLTEIIGRYLGEEITVVGSGRTDAGVHALGQVANFKTEKYLDIDVFVGEINTYLPHDIQILSMQAVDERFHARLNAISKTYTYIIDNANIRDIFGRKYCFRVDKKLNIDAMKAAASYMTGEHDYTSFCGNKKMKKSAVRNVSSIEITNDEGSIRIEYTANGFLQNMVRIMTGTLIEVGLGTKKSEDIVTILEAKDRGKAGFMAPPEGLFLRNVVYQED